jgi:hypothetical protein
MIRPAPAREANGSNSRGGPSGTARSPSPPSAAWRGRKTGGPAPDTLTTPEAHPAPSEANACNIALAAEANPRMPAGPERPAESPARVTFGQGEVETTV